jgi:hypothetical protein
MYQEHTDSGVGMSDYEDRHSYTGPLSSILGQPRVPSIQSMITIVQDGLRPSSNPIIKGLPRHFSSEVSSYERAIDRHNISHEPKKGNLSTDLVGESPDDISTTASSSTQQAMADYAVQSTDKTNHEPENLSLQRSNCQTESHTIENAAEDEVQRDHNTQERSTSPQPEMELSVATSSVPHSSEDEAVDLSEGSVDESSMSCLNDIGAQKEEILDRLMLHFYELFAGTTFAQYSGNNSSSPAVSSKQSAQPPGKAAKSSGRKRKSNERSEGDERGDEDEDKPSKRSRSLGDADRDESSSARRLACPYYKKHHGRFQPSRACAGPGWLTVHRLKYGLLDIFSYMPANPCVESIFIESTPCLYTVDAVTISLTMKHN